MNHATHAPPETASLAGHEPGQQHPIGVYLKVWAYLFVLSTLSYLVDFFHVQGLMRWILIITFMLLKAGLIVAIFMHLAWERVALIYAILVPPLALGSLVFLMWIEADYTFWTRIVFLGGQGLTMDSWERSKTAMAVSMACVVLAGSYWISDLVAAPAYPEKRGYPIAGVAPVDLAAVQRGWPGAALQPGERSGLIGYIRNIESASVPALDVGKVEAAEPVDLGTLLQTASADRGRRTAQVCASCHTMESGGANWTGPNLWAVVGRPVARHGGFAYSPALVRAGGQWEYETLDRFLASPARAVPGTKMSYAGLRNPRDRANLLAYLATLGPGAPPFPPPAPAAPARQEGGPSPAR